MLKFGFAGNDSRLFFFLVYAVSVWISCGVLSMFWDRQSAKGGTRHTRLCGSLQILSGDKNTPDSGQCQRRYTFLFLCAKKSRGQGQKKKKERIEQGSAIEHEKERRTEKRKKRKKIGTRKSKSGADGRASRACRGASRGPPRCQSRATIQWARAKRAWPTRVRSTRRRRR